MQRCEDLLYKYLKENKKAYTFRALQKRLNNIISDNDENVCKYGRKNLQKILNKMKSDGIINSTLHNGKDHYFIS